MTVKIFVAVIVKNGTKTLKNTLNYLGYAANEMEYGNGSTNELKK